MQTVFKCLLQIQSPTLIRDCVGSIRSCRFTFVSQFQEQLIDVSQRSINAQFVTFCSEKHQRAQRTPKPVGCPLGVSAPFASFLALFHRPLYDSEFSTTPIAVVVDKDSKRRVFMSAEGYMHRLFMGYINDTRNVNILCTQIVATGGQHCL